jgi:hypothetical protein
MRNQNLFDHETAEQAREYLVTMDVEQFFGGGCSCGIHEENDEEQDEVINRKELTKLIRFAVLGSEAFRVYCERHHNERLHQQLGYFAQTVDLGL